MNPLDNGFSHHFYTKTGPFNQKYCDILTENSKHDLYRTFNKISVREFLHINNILITK